MAEGGDRRDDDENWQNNENNKDNPFSFNKFIMQKLKSDTNDCNKEENLENSQMEDIFVDDRKIPRVDENPFSFKKFIQTNNNTTRHSNNTNYNYACSSNSNNNVSVIGSELINFNNSAVSNFANLDNNIDAYNNENTHRIVVSYQNSYHGSNNNNNYTNQNLGMRENDFSQFNGSLTNGSPVGIATLDLANDLPDFVQDHRPRNRFSCLENNLPDFALCTTVASASLRTNSLNVHPLDNFPSPNVSSSAHIQHSNNLVLDNILNLDSNASVSNAFPLDNIHFSSFSINNFPLDNFPPNNFNHENEASSNLPDNISTNNFPQVNSVRNISPSNNFPPDNIPLNFPPDNIPSFNITSFNYESSARTRALSQQLQEDTLSHSFNRRHFNLNNSENDLNSFPNTNQPNSTFNNISPSNCIPPFDEDFPPVGNNSNIKLLPDFLSDSVVSSSSVTTLSLLSSRGDHSSQINSQNGHCQTNDQVSEEYRRLIDLQTSNDNLRRELEETRLNYFQELERNNLLNKELQTLRSEEKQERTVLENLMQQVETNLNSTMIRANEAEEANIALREQMKILQIENESLRHQSITNTMGSHSGDPEFKTNATENKLQYEQLQQCTIIASNQISVAATEAERLIRQLLNGVESLKSVSDYLMSANKLRDLSKEGDDINEPH